MKVLIVDDDPVAIQVLADLLEEDGHRCRFASDWVGMVEELSKGAFDVVFLDVGLPGIPGTALVEQARGLSREGTAVMLYSGLPEAELRRLAEQCGAHGYLAKEYGLGGVAGAMAVARSVARRPGGGPTQSASLVPSGLPRRRRLSRPPAPVAGVEIAAAPPDPAGHAAPPSPPADRVASPPSGTALGAGASSRHDRPAPIPSTMSDPPDTTRDGWQYDVLLVDGDLTRRRQLATWFLGKGFAVEAKAGSQEAMDHLLVTMPPPDLLLLDAELMEAGARDMIHWVRSSRSHRHVVLILLESADKPARDAAELRRLGLDQALRGRQGLERLPRIVSNRVRMMQSLRRLRTASEDIGFLSEV